MSSANAPSVTIGIDIGGTSVRAGVVDADGGLIAEIAQPIATDAAELEDILVGMIAHLSDDHPVGAVGLAVAGFLSTGRDRVMFAPHLPWRDAPVAEIVSQRVHLPVVMDHDVNCAAWAEHRRGAARGSAIGLVIAVGTGIGAGLVVDGRIYRGRYGVAPELGHVTVVPGGRPCSCGKRGCLERYCSGTALVDAVRQRIDDGAATPLADLASTAGALTGRAVGAAARSGDPVALDAFDELGRWLGTGMAMVGDILDPEIIVIGGGVSSVADLFLPAARAALAAELTGGDFRPHPRVEVAHFGSAASTIGAALLAAGDVD